MKIKYTLEDPDTDKSVALVDDICKSGLITDRDNQIIGIYDTEIILDDVYPSEELSAILENYPGYKIFTDPKEVDAFHPEDGLPDVTKIGTVPSPTYEIQDQGDNDLSTLQLFPESEINTFSPQGSGEVENKDSFNNSKIMKKNFNDPTLDPNGVSKDGQQSAVVAEAKKDNANYTPAEGSFSSVDVEPFSQAEIDKANDVQVEVNGNEEVKVFSDEEIESITDPTEAETLANEMEEEETTFSEKKKRLFAAKRRIRRANSKRADRKSFAEELTDKEKSDVIEDIVAILNDAPEIREAVAEEVDELSPEVTTTSEKVEETVTETPADETVITDTAVETPVEEPSTAAEEETVEETVTETPEETVEETVTETPSEEIEEMPEDYDADNVGDLFCKSFSEDSVANARRAMLAEMAKYTPSRH